MVGGLDLGKVFFYFLFLAGGCSKQRKLENVEAPYTAANTEGAARERKLWLDYRGT